MSLTDTINAISALGSLVTILVAAVTAIYFLRTRNPDMKEIVRTCGIAFLVCLLVIVGGIYGLHVAFPTTQATPSIVSTNSTNPVNTPILPATTGISRPTVQTSAASPSVGTGGSPEGNPYTTSMQKLVLNDTLRGPNSTDASQWEQDGSPTPVVGNQGSTFCGIAADNAYHAQVMDPNGITSNDASLFDFCPAMKTNFMNFTFEVQVNVTGDNQQSSGGIIFREVDTNNMYLWVVRIDGTAVFKIIQSGSVNSLADDIHVAKFKRGFSQVNTLAVVVNGTHIDFYVNGVSITTLTSLVFSFGSIGVAVGDNSDTIFSNAKVWTS